VCKTLYDAIQAAAPVLPRLDRPIDPGIPFFSVRAAAAVDNADTADAGLLVAMLAQLED